MAAWHSAICRDSGHLPELRTPAEIWDTCWDSKHLPRMRGTVYRWGRRHGAARAFPKKAFPCLPSNSLSFQPFVAARPRYSLKLRSRNRRLSWAGVLQHSRGR